ncbi:MAG: radical SAM protein [Nitrosopumilus sp.]
MTKTKFHKIKCSSALNVSKLPDLDYSFNPYLGCQIGCRYCYALSFLQKKELGLDWGNFVMAKENILEILARDVKKKPEGVVGVSTITDPYQSIEKKLELTRNGIEMLSNNGFHVSIQTKSNLVLRDLDLISPGTFDIGVTITTSRPELSRILEPSAPLPEKRAQILEECSKKGVETWLFFGPIIPHVNDSHDEIVSVVKLAKRSNSVILYDRFREKRWLLEVLLPKLDELESGLGQKVKDSINDLSYWRQTSSLIERVCRDQGVNLKVAFPSRQEDLLQTMLTSYL